MAISAAVTLRSALVASRTSEPFGALISPPVPESVFGSRCM
jgi:hypothetical protein